MRTLVVGCVCLLFVPVLPTGSGYFNALFITVRVFVRAALFLLPRTFPRSTGSSWLVIILLDNFRWCCSPTVLLLLFSYYVRVLVLIHVDWCFTFCLLFAVVGACATVRAVDYAR